MTVGSLKCLGEELRWAAEELGIPLKKGELADEVAARINFLEPLSQEDMAGTLEDERTAWLLVYEGCRLALGSKVALAFAG